MKRTLRWMVAIALASLPLESAAAQRLRGVVVDSVSRRPIAAAAVLVDDAAGATRQRTLTDASGRFAVSLVAGAATIVVRHVGHSAQTRRLPIAGDSALFALAPLPVSIRAVVTQDNVCADLPRHAAAADVWDRVRDAFLVASIGMESASGSVRVLGYERAIDTVTGAVSHQTVLEGDLRTMRPARAARSADEFADRGYLNVMGSQSALFGPDPDVLLDPRFESGHCFFTPPNAAARGEMSVGFVPVRDRPDVVEIAGVLTVNQKTLMPTRLTFRYTNIGPAMPDGALGGDLVFRAGAAGVPVIERWVIRTSPYGWVKNPTQRWVPAALYLLSFASGGVATAESGAEVVTADWSDGSRWSNALGTLAGSTRRADSAGPARGAFTFFVGTADTARTDSAGRFDFRTIIPGRYRLRAADDGYVPFELPQADDQLVDVHRDEVARPRIDLMSPYGVALRSCRGAAKRDSGGSIFVRPSALNRDTAVLIRAEWEQWILASFFPLRPVGHATTQVACNVPWGSSLTFAAIGRELGGDSVVFSHKPLLTDTATLRMHPLPPVRGVIRHGVWSTGAPPPDTGGVSLRE